jgi:GMP synthase-like glutamine amidotransferase
MRIREGFMRYILVVDPAVGSVQLDALNALARLLAELGEEACLYTIALEQGKRRLRDLLLEKRVETQFLKDFCETAALKGCSIANCEQVSQRPCEAICVSDIAGIVSLGSDGNVTEDLPWMRSLASDLRPLLFEHKIPFYGSCFSHQLIAWMMGSKVDFLKERAKNPELMHKGARDVRIVHPKLAALFGKKESFPVATLPIWHAQEVWDIPDGFELGATSDVCEIEGLVHSSLPIFSLQAHPEWFHGSGAGWVFLKNFLSLALRNGAS